MSNKFKKARTATVAKTIVTPTVPKEKPAKIKLVTDTACQGLGKLSWEEVYNFIEAEKPTVTEVKAIVPDEDDSDSNSETPLKALVNYFLHKIAARENMFPYYDVVRWVIDNITIIKRTFVSAAGTNFGYFRAENIKVMYHLQN